MTMPVVNMETIMATFERAEQRHSVAEYSAKTLIKMHKENPTLTQGLCAAVSGMAQDEETIALAMLACGLMYDCLKTQEEADELNEIYGE